jgi:heptosyltransferase-1
MGDVLHTLPAAASLKHSLPHSRLTWIVNPRWRPLLEGNPFVDEIVDFDRRSLRSILETRRKLRAGRFDIAVDFQGLIQSALVAAAARPEKIYGFDSAQLKEKPAALFYSATANPKAAHVVDKNLELAAAAGASNFVVQFPLPEGELEGDLPEGDFVLTSPLAGWTSKQWPTENFADLARRLRAKTSLELVVNGAPESAEALRQIAGVRVHLSGIKGLIYATRRATAVVGVDSGPVHMAAALFKPGVAIFGPTDPARNGPYGGSITALRAPGAETSYKRDREIASSMRAVTVDEVFAALKAKLDV